MAIDIKLGLRDELPHKSLTATPSTPMAFSSFIEVMKMEESEEGGENSGEEEIFVWGAMAELEKEADGFVTTRAQGKEAKKAGEKRKDISKVEEKKLGITH